MEMETKSYLAWEEMAEGWVAGGAPDTLPHTACSSQMPHLHRYPCSTLLNQPLPLPLGAVIWRHND